MDLKLRNMKAGSRHFSTYDVYIVDECVDQERIINTHV